MAWRSVFVRSMKTTSVRGTITSRTRVSPSSKTEWIIWRSPDSMTLLASARSTSSRSSASDANGPSLKPRPGVIALPTRMSTLGSGPSTLVNAISGPAASSAMRSECCRPTVRGETPMTTNETTTMIPSASSIAHQRSPSGCGPDSEPPRGTIRSSMTTVTSTIAAVSVSIRRNSAVLR